MGEYNLPRPGQSTMPRAQNFRPTNLGQNRNTKSHNTKNGVSAGMFYGLVAVLMVTNAATFVALFMGGDIAKLSRGTDDLVLQSYETRIADLRTEVDRLNSRQYARAGDLNLQLQDLVSQQDELAVQHQYVRALADMAKDLGIDTAENSIPIPAQKSELVSQAHQITTSGLPNGPTTDVEAVRAKLTAMVNDTDFAISTISNATKSSTDKVVSGLQKIGLQPLFSEPTQAAIGGPFEGIDNTSPSQSLDTVNRIVQEFKKFETARQALRDAPVHHPLKEATRISSRFGPRRDPFLNKTGFHSGMDFAARSGTVVRSAGAGKVIFSGRKGGYGNLVEIEHQNGLTTRYGHLSKTLVKTGQSVVAGTSVGKVGSTGRSTGPHLHFEVRKADKAIDPQKFLTIGNELRQFM